MTNSTMRQTIGMGPVSIYSEQSLHSRTKQPYMNASGHEVRGRFFPGVLYLAVGVIVAMVMGLSMENPLTWLTVLMWPLVLFLEMFVFMLKAAVVVLALVYTVLLVDKAIRFARFRLKSRAVRLQINEAKAARNRSFNKRQFERMMRG